jgi:peptidoglycan-associated lipoprotein
LLLVLGLMTACPPKYPKCDKDKDCKENEFCVNGMCQQCRNDRDCKPGERCAGGRCEKKTCGADADCGPNESCIDGECKPCQSDDQCGEGGKCQNGRCKRAPLSSVSPTERPTGCSLQTVYFDFNEHTLTSEASGVIDSNADCIKQSKGKSVSLVGHTDPRGTEEYNLALSDRRAQSVRDRLVRTGVDGSRLKAVAKGEIEATGSDESGWARDRRVDFEW